MAKLTDIALVGGLVLLGGGLLKGLEMFKVPDITKGIVKAFETGGATVYTHPETGLSQGSTYIKDFFRNIGVVTDFGTETTQMPVVHQFNEDIAILGSNIQLAETQRAELVAKIEYQNKLNNMWLEYINNPVQYVIDYSIPAWDSAQVTTAINHFKSNLATGLGGVAQWESELMRLG